MKRFLTYILFIAFIAGPSHVQSQTVGLVLSGGGASGMAHVGMLRALEEADIPIDYITGTSMGAIIGGLYASGMSVDELEHYFTSVEFIDVVSGELDDRYIYQFKKDTDDAGMIKLKIDPDTLLTRTIPSYIVSPVQMDMEMLESVSSAIAVAGYDFDNLMIPFRCVAADIVSKEQVIFKEGELHQALRASSSFPFYFKPLSLEGRILFDGGLYNNFPLDVMYDEFGPDVIIGCSVSLETPAPNVDDLFSQIENMIVNRGSEELPCEEGIIVRPQTGVGTLEFQKSQQSINIGYTTARLMMDSIRLLVSDRVSLVEREKARRDFVVKQKTYELGEVELRDISPAAKRYFRKVLRLDGKHRAETLDDFKPLYYRVFGDDKVNYVYPNIRYNTETQLYDLSLKIEEERKLVLDFGGNFSSRPVNTGFIGAKYQLLGATPKSFTAKSYFGKFYNSIQLQTRLDVPGRNPYFVALDATRQQWDYFRSFATFFQETKPSFILENERFARLTVGRPIANKGSLTWDARYAYEDDEYYLTEDFTALDTADVTLFESLSSGLTYTRNTLNRKLYADEGTRLKLDVRLIKGREVTRSGSTGIIDELIRDRHEWLSIGLSYENYFTSIGKLQLGYQLDARYTSLEFFANHQATLLNAPFFQPIPESRTLFQNEFRAHQFAAIGLKMVHPISPNIDLRIENYLFQPVNEIVKQEDLTSRYSEDFAQRFYIGSGGVVIHSPLGPISASLNYYDQREDPWSWIINFGYLIFNDRALQ